jgi:hypothetical protein
VACAFAAAVLCGTVSLPFEALVGTRGNGNLQINTPHSIATDYHTRWH